MQGLVGLIGVLLTFAGIHLLWRARHEIIYWVDRLLLIFRKSFDEAARSAEVAKPEPDSGGATAVRLSSGARHGHQILVLLIGVGLLALGQFLVMLYIASLLI